LVTALVTAGFALACGGDSTDLPAGWEAAKPVGMVQSECSNSALADAPPETVEVRAWGPPVEVAYHDARFRCAQKLCAYLRNDGTTAAMLVQPCEMNPGTVAKCNCQYQVGLSVPGTRSAIEVHRRWDNLNRPNPPVLIGRRER
jgi:hypothetical protein